MKCAWPQSAILRLASLLAPGDQRVEFIAGWQSELWYIPRQRATRFCLGAFADALWLRRNNLSPERRSGTYLESPLRCLLFLAVLAGACVWICLFLPAPRTMTPSAHLSARNVLDGCASMLAVSFVYLAAIGAAMGRSALAAKPLPWLDKLRLGIFLALKVVLVQPIVLFAFLASLGIPLGTIGLATTWTLLYRWVLIDQRRRCPVCLRSLTNAVRIGTPSRTLLEWYGAESICPRGHGLLHSPEISASYSGTPQWLGLGRSWSGLFPESGGMRQ